MFSDNFENSNILEEIGEPVMVPILPSEARQLIALRTMRTAQAVSRISDLEVEFELREKVAALDAMLMKAISTAKKEKAKRLADANAVEVKKKKIIRKTVKPVAKPQVKPANEQEN